MGFCLAVKSSSQGPDLELPDALTRLKPWTYQLTGLLKKSQHAINVMASGARPSSCSHFALDRVTTFAMTIGGIYRLFQQAPSFMRRE